MPVPPISARGAFLLRTQLAPPWSMRIQDEAPLTLVAVLRGSAWVRFDDGATRELTAGDVAVLRGPEQVCTTPAGQEVVMTGLGLRTWGNDPDGPTTLLVGTYQLSGEVSRRLLGAEISRDEPGQEAVLDRLLDLLLIDVLRKWFAGPGSGPWYRAYADPVVGRALRLLQHRPEHPWTVATLAAVARRVGYSSPFALSAAFKRAHGVSPQRHRQGAAARPG
ncbi:AraC family transcriptional regulator [Amycolatopsis deserti]|uniref:AraC family transcriptional regulator n=1 Tax=Amycolatopsis deserti TaxID=185696 RepID=UPI0017487F63|nr:AraC family transcriptional regulator [Amycolatopsis deserti]